MLRLLILPLLALLMGYLISPAPPQHEIGGAYPEHLTGAFTGGFGEQTCHSCHFDHDINSGEGTLSIEGLSDTALKAGEELELQIILKREDMARAGFQLSARFEDGSQAGEFLIDENKRLMKTKTAPDTVQYIQHSEEGSNPIEEDKNHWTIKWKAPVTASGAVIFNIAANAANGDQSEFGDFIFTKEIKRKL